MKENNLNEIKYWGMKLKKQKKKIRKQIRIKMDIKNKWNIILMDEIEKK